MSVYFGVPRGKISVIAPRVGFGGKAGIKLKTLAYVLAGAVGGRPVRFANRREMDMIGSPENPGL